jgi:hypothetical protein
MSSENKSSPLSKLLADYVNIKLAEESSTPSSAPPSTPSEEKSLTPAVTMLLGGHKKSRTKGKLGKQDGTCFSVVSQVLPQMKHHMPDNKVFKFTQTYQGLAVVSSSNSVFANYAISFTAANLTQIASLAAIFDQYMINLVELWLIPRSPATPYSSSTNRGLMYTVIDYDDASTLTTASDYLSYTNCVVCPATDGVYRSFAPHIATAAYSGSFTSYANSKPIWIDAASTGVQHFGFKAGFGQTAAAADNITYDIIIRLSTSWRNVR